MMESSDVDSAGIDTGPIDVTALEYGSPPVMRGAPDDATQRDIARVFPAHATCGRPSRPLGIHQKLINPLRQPTRID